MEPLAITFATLLVAKVADELVAKSNNVYVKKYVGVFSYVTKTFSGIFNFKSKWRY